jgi:hypothetical protein
MEYSYVFGFSRQRFFSHFSPEDGRSMFFQPLVFMHKAIRYHSPDGHNLDVIKKFENRTVINWYLYRVIKNSLCTWRLYCNHQVHRDFFDHPVHWITLVQGLLKYQAENFTFAVSGCFRYQGKNHNSSVIKPKAKSPCQLHRVGGKGVCHWREQEMFAEYSCLQVRLNFKLPPPNSVIRKFTALPKKATCVQTELLQCVSSSVLRRIQMFKVLCSVFLLSKEELWRT